MSAVNSQEKHAAIHKHFWSDSAERYLATLYKDATEYPALIMRHNYILDLLDSRLGRVLDIGCGPGEMVSNLIAKGHEVYGVDIAEGMLRVASKNVAEKSCTHSSSFQCGNIEALHFKDEMFDVIICAGVIEYLKTDTIALQEINRVLKPGGILLITARNKACPFRVFDIVSDRIKESQGGLKLVKILRKSFHRQAPDYISYRKHFPWELDRKVQEHGFQKVDSRFFHFYPFFVPFDIFFPQFFIRWGLKMERLSPSSLGILASGYILKAKKVKTI
jgi:ubiquinone/menaquinone biosynthesis C-methylase UbiE